MVIEIDRHRRQAGSWLSEEKIMTNFALIRADLNSNNCDIISTHRTEAAAYRAAEKHSGTTGEIGLYVAHRKPNGEWESRLEARDRRERQQ